MKKELPNAKRLPNLSPLLAWYKESARALPWRETRDPYRIWVSEIMLQQTRVEAVIPYYHRFLAALPDVAALANAPEEQILKLWEGLGYYSRVRNMQKAAKVIMSQHGGVFPNNYADIMALPGIGEYTAGAIGAFAFDLPVPAVDGNVLRVAARLIACDADVLAPTTRRVLTERVREAQNGLPPADFNQAIIELGAIVCLPNGMPKCEQCPLADRCAARAQGRETELPVRRAPAPRKIAEKTVLILREGDRVALRKRPDVGLLAGLFEPYSLDGIRSTDEVRAFLKTCGVTPLYLTPLERAKHIFTHVEWHMVGFEVILDTGDFAKMLQNGEKNGMDALFLAPRDEIDRCYAVPTAYRAYRPYM